MISLLLEPVFFKLVGKIFFVSIVSWSDNQLSCSILRKIFKMRVGDYEQIINYDSLTLVDNQLCNHLFDQFWFSNLFICSYIISDIVTYHFYFWKIIYCVSYCIDVINFFGTFCDTVFVILSAILLFIKSSASFNVF